nr:MAG TPA: hypothetical protein [Bacteriophage sp.]
MFVLSNRYKKTYVMSYQMSYLYIHFVFAKLFLSYLSSYQLSYQTQKAVFFTVQIGKKIPLFQKRRSNTA